jgi:GNAT superfamily N-acetyltransferase
MSDRSPTVRPGTAADSRAAFDVFLASASDLSVRIGAAWEPEPEPTWRRLRPLYERLGEHAAEWWVAEDEASGELVGYARSIARGGLFELSEFFVLPGRQSAGVGRELLARAFPDGRGEVRVIIATTDVRAQARYYRAGTVARFPVAGLTGTPRHDVEPGHEIEATPASDADVSLLDEIEAEVLEYPRGDEFRWLLEQREGWLYRRAGRPIGFAFVGRTGSGPIAALDPADQPAILAHVESRAAALEVKELGLEVPMINDVAVRHLLARGFRMDQFLTLLMSNRPFGRFDRFIGFSPPFVL